MNEIIIQAQDVIFDVDRIPLALAALFIMGVFSFASPPMAGNANPLIWQVIDRIFGKIGDKLNTKKRHAGDLFFRGAVIALIAVWVACVIAIAIKLVMFKTPFYVLAEIVALCTAISAGGMWRVAWRIQKTLADGDTQKGAYYELSQTLRANLNKSDDHGITRLTINALIDGVTTSAVAPVFWFIVAGLPGAYVYAALAACRWRFAVADGHPFGYFMRGVLIIMEIVPNIIACALLSVAAMLTPTAHAVAGIKGVAKGITRGSPLTAAAHILKIPLGGPYQSLNGEAIKKPWISPAGASAKINHAHIKRALYLTITAYFLLFSTLIVIYGGLHSLLS